MPPGGVFLGVSDDVLVHGDGAGADAESRLILVLQLIKQHLIQWQDATNCGQVGDQHWTSGALSKRMFRQR
jgi:hypothetical protein